jgi:hypothetical protein
MVPKTYVGFGNMLFALEKGPMEPLGQRIIELRRTLSAPRVVIRTQVSLHTCRSAASRRARRW